ncbi:MAG: right-handed parallel beta-helix repeat-containing protein [Clostridia bacterium]|nr:right-handed parallel beta-helix repeat-containing protein [Clostridia bacterium]
MINLTEKAGIIMQEYVVGISKDNSIMIREAIEYCQKNNIKKLRLERGEYHFFADTADEHICCISNHGFNGYKRTVFKLDGMRDFEIDGGGSLFVLHGITNTFIIDNCENISLKNFSVLTEKTQHGEFKVLAVGENFVDIENCGKQDYTYIWDHLYMINCGKMNLVDSATEIDGKTGEFKEADQCFGEDWLKLSHKEIKPGVIRVYNSPKKPDVGNEIIMMTPERYANGIFMKNSKNMSLENVFVHSCYGMGFLSQMCENVSMYKCGTDRYEGKLFSCNADATHFVGCTGKIDIRECTFRYQFDDAVNIHGIYTKIIGKTDKTLTVKYMHPDAVGVGLYKKGDRIEICNPKTLLPEKVCTIESVKVLNVECTMLTVKEYTDGIELGFAVDNIDVYPEVLVEKCIIENNRARGMLLASRGKTVIKDNYFHTPGTAIKLESDGLEYFEAGCVKELVIENNVFDRCKYVAGGWGKDVIFIVPRQETEEERYYHGKFVISNNDFSTCEKSIINPNNIEELYFEGNKLPDNEFKNITAEHCGKVKISE